MCEYVLDHIREFLTDLDRQNTSDQEKIRMTRKATANNKASIGANNLRKSMNKSVY
jgi:hypothetical protein